MKQPVRIIPIILAISLLFAVRSMAGPEIIGAPKCKVCHTAKTGDQWQKWVDSAHAGAYDVLGSDSAAAIAAERGLGDPRHEAECLKCHTTKGFLGSEVAVAANGKYDETEGVGCESCHGPGSVYKSRKVMADSAAAQAAGLILDRRAEFCIRCHNEESPTYGGFEFEEDWARIAHPVSGSP